MPEANPVEILHVEHDDLRRYFVAETLRLGGIEHHLHAADSYNRVVEYLGQVVSRVIPVPEILILNANLGSSNDGSDGKRIVNTFHELGLGLPKIIGLSDKSTRSYGITVNRDVIKGTFGEIPRYVRELVSKR